MDNRTQEARILAELRSGRAITPYDALYNFNCLRLSARIYDLRRKGYKINMRLAHKYQNLKHYAVYWIAPKDRRKP
jgi:hypothetical protein